MLELWHRNINNTMDVAGALLPFTHVVRPELTIHVQEVLTQADKDAGGEPPMKHSIPEINEPTDDDKSPVKSPVKRKFNKDVVNGRKGNSA